MGKFRQFYTELSAWDTPIFSFPDDNLVNNKRFSSNLLYVLTVMRLGFELLMSKFRQIFTELSARDTSIFSCMDDNLS